jgi:hypothetical protein
MSTPLIPIPDIAIEVGFVPDTPAQGGTTFIIGDATNGKLGTGTLGTSIAYTDISEFVRSISITRPSTRLQGPLYNYQAGTLSIVLDNSDGRFDPDNLSGPYASSGVSQLVAMVPIRVSATWGGVTYRLYFGYSDGWLPAQVTFQGDYAELTVSATDAFKILAGINLPAIAAQGAGDDTGARVRRILTLAGWYTSAEFNSIDIGDSVLQATTYGSDALSLMQIAVDSEIGQLYIDGAGAITFRHRQALLDDARSNTVQAVFGDLADTVHSAGTELTCAAIVRASDDTTIVNDVQATRVGGSLQEVKDTASISQYLFPRTYSRTDLILQNDSDALQWAQWILYVGKTGENRFESISVDPQSDPVNLWPQVLGRDIGDRIQIWTRPPNVVNGTPWSLTNNFGSAPANNFTIPTTSVPLLSVGDVFQIYLSGGALKENTYFRITSIGTDFFGNTAITFAPNAQAVLAVGDVVTQTGGAIGKDCFIAGITHTLDVLNSQWLTTWTLQDASKFGSFFTIGNSTLGRIGSNALAF